MNENRKPTVGLFVTCLVDLFRPSVGLATVKLLEKAGCKIEVPVEQTCCGQPAYNTGDRKAARKIATSVIKRFERYDYVVVPSGSCASMIKVHFPKLFNEGSGFRTRAEALAEKTFELVSFLSDVMDIEIPKVEYGRTVTYHDSCSGLRELKIQKQPRKLLKNVDGLHLKEMADANVCCGFGGTFCVKYPDISNDLVSKKMTNIASSGADVLLAGDLGCLLNMAGKLQREGIDIEVRHIAEVLAGEANGPAIGETD